MVGGHDSDASPLSPDSSPSSCRGHDPEVLRCAAAKRNDDFGLHEIELRHQEARTGFGLARQRCSVVGRSALDDIADVNAVPVVAHRRDHAVEQLTRPPHEGEPLLIFVEARSLSDEYQIRGGRSAREDALGSPTAQLAARAGGSLLGQDLEAGFGILVAQLHPTGASQCCASRRSLRCRETDTPQRFFPLEKLSRARDDRRELIFRVSRHVRASIGRFR